MKRSILTLSLLAGFAGVTVAEPLENEIVLATPDFNVTTRDFHYYVKSTIPEDKRDQVLSQEGTVRDIYENLYVIKAFARRGEKNDVVPDEELEWNTEHYRERLLMNRQIQAQVDEAMAGIDWEQAAQEEYTANKERYQRPEQVNADHILVNTEERSEEEALGRAEEARRKLMDGESFEEVAMEYSDDPSVDQNQGALGFFTRDKMVKPFAEAAFAMEEPGAISEPVKTKFGYHIIRFNERKEAGEMPFEKVKDRIIAQLKKQRTRKVRSEIIGEVKSGAQDLGLQVNAELLQKLEKQYAGDQSDETEKADDKNGE